MTGNGTGAENSRAVFCKVDFSLSRSEKDKKTLLI